MSGFIIRYAASKYSLNGDGKLFKQSQRIRKAHAKQSTIADYEASTQAAVDEAFGFLKSATIDSAPAPAKGHRHVKAVPVSGNYVIFSDHHITNSGHRQAFFTEKKNAVLYGKVLEAYNGKQYTLIENGDVEELVIFEPNQFPDEMDRRRHMSLAQLRAARRPVRLDQLDRILSDGQLTPWLEAIKAFDDDGRLLRIAGNHDFDLQRPAFFDLFKSRFPNQEKVWDYVLLREGDDATGATRYAILHGHQFDLVSNPTFGARFGETLSETSGLWFQGADRTWGWEEDGPRRWVEGTETLMNWLVEDDPSQSRRVEVPSGADDLPARVTSPMRDRVFRKFLEGDLFHHNIAWEYFKNRRVGKILRKEVLKRDGRFFKFRHLDEEHIRKRMLETFPDAAVRPTLILGHSHEVRRQSYSIDGGVNWDGYLNTGAAGRFENLIWAVEVVAGQSYLVSWSIETAGEPPVRREWTPLRQIFLTPSAPKSIP